MRAFGPFAARAVGIACVLVLAGLAPDAAPVPAVRADAAPAPGSGIPPLTDDRGRAVTLRGWNVEDKAHRGPDALTAVTEKHFRDLRGQGFDFARLLIFWDDLEPDPGRYSERYLRRIGRILDWAEKYRVHVLLDAHQDVFGPAFGHRGIPRWATRTDGLPFTPNPGDWFSEYFQPAVQRAFTHLYEDADLRRAQARMWRVLAGRFGGHPAVLGYDLVNEPMGEPRAGEDLPTAARRIEAGQLTPMYRRLARAIRRVDRRTWLFVEPTPVVGEGVPTGLGGIGDPRVVYAPHFYGTAMEAGGDYDPAAGWIEAYEAAVTGYPKRYGVPVVIGEWGPPDGGLPHMNQFYRDALASMARYSSGWAGYVWCYGGGYCALDAAGRFRPNKDRTAAPYAAAVAGRVRGEAYGPESRRYRLTYTAGSPAPTEISLPPDPRGWRIAVAGRAWSDARAVARGRSAVVRVRALPGARVAVTARPG
ncbi:cellulase family glycosylhydrolase [Streptomyces sp. NPDC050610]|uniref:glycoside hydrolase family 5 protein n=1 Tax=Streptomyces sp. NPDC050610 TaxID=3157097 RepID=UPI003420D259